MPTLNDFGAPGTTSEDKADGIFSEQDVQVKDPKTNKISLPVKGFEEGNKPSSETKAPWEDYSAAVKEEAPPWEDFKSAEKPTGPKGSIKGSAMAVGKELLATAETVGGLLGFVINAVEAPIMDVAGTLSGSQQPFEDTNKALDKFNNTKIGKLLSTPVSALGIDLEDTTVKNVFGEIGKIIDKTAHSASSVNGNTAFCRSRTMRSATPSR